MSYTSTYLTSVEALQKKYPIDTNTTQINIIANIQKAEAFYIIQILGKEKYDSLIDYVNTVVKNNGTRIQENDILIEQYIEPIVGWFVISELLYNQAFKTKNTPQNGNFSEFAEINKAALKFKADAEAYATILKNKIKEDEVNGSETLKGSNSDYIQTSLICFADTSDYDRPILNKYNTRFI